MDKFEKAQSSDSAQLELFQQETDTNKEKRESVDVHPDASYEFTSLFDRLSQSTFRSHLENGIENFNIAD